MATKTKASPGIISDTAQDPKSPLPPSLPYQALTFMFKIKRDTAPAAFRNDFREISHRYPTGFSQSNFVESNILSNQTKLVVSSRGPRLWNRLLNQEQKNMAFDSHCVRSDAIPYRFLW